MRFYFEEEEEKEEAPCGYKHCGANCKYCCKYCEGGVNESKILISFRAEELSFMPF